MGATQSPTVQCCLALSPLASRHTPAQTLLPAGVRVEQAEAHAGVALHAVEEVHPQALAPPAHVAERAVVDGAARLIVPQVTDVAVVGRQLGRTGRAGAYMGATQ